MSSRDTPPVIIANAAYATSLDGLQRHHTHTQQYSRGGGRERRNTSQKSHQKRHRQKGEREHARIFGEQPAMLDARRYVQKYPAIL
eukprot:scaffold26631_cov139-Skeletonema_menzelii.AAC.18